MQSKFNVQNRLSMEIKKYNKSVEGVGSEVKSKNLQSSFGEQLRKYTDWFKIFKKNDDDLKNYVLNSLQIHSLPPSQYSAQFTTKTDKNHWKFTNGVKNWTQSFNHKIFLKY